ncbi:MAG: site-2 protease family protein [Gammaproteobacteria bacterium]|nr:site-2 protease family protein [Gammaproteobacteria bacterium]
MLELLARGEYTLFMVILFAIVFSLTFHEFGHALTAKLYGDDTAEKLGRLTLNPFSHIDPVGLLMVVMVGFGYAKPVPFTPRNLRYPWASAVVAFAGPFMNLLLAVLAINLYVWGAKSGIEFFQGPGPATLLIYLAHINLLLMLFNLIPLGPLDGHYILPYFLPRSMGHRYQELNARYGVGVFLVLIGLSIMGLPIFRYLMDLSASIMPLITIV